MLSRVGRVSTPDGERHYSYSDDRQPGLGQARTHAIFELMGLYESGINAQRNISNEQTEHRFFIAPGVIYTRFGTGCAFHANQSPIPLH